MESETQMTHKTELRGQPPLPRDLDKSVPRTSGNSIARIAALEAQLEAARKNEARYLFLAGINVPAHSIRWPRVKLEWWQLGCWQPFTGDTLSANIDAALEATTPEKQW